MNHCRLECSVLRLHPQKTGHMITSAVLVVLIRHFRNVNTSEKQAKYEQEEKSERVFLLFMAVKETLVFLCLPAAATRDTMDWETGSAKIWKIIKK